MVFDWALIAAPWSAEAFGARSGSASRSSVRTGGSTNVLSNHDQSVRRRGSRRRPGSTDTTRSRKAAAVVLLAIRGTPFLYYGEEIGMLDVRSRPTRSSIRRPGGPGRARFQWWNRDRAGRRCRGRASPGPGSRRVGRGSGSATTRDPERGRPGRRPGFGARDVPPAHRPAARRARRSGAATLRAARRRRRRTSSPGRARRRRAGCSSSSTSPTSRAAPRRRAGRGRLSGRSVAPISIRAARPTDGVADAAAARGGRSCSAG